MHRHMLLFGAVLAGAAGLIFAVQRPNDTPPGPHAGAAATHETAHHTEMGMMSAMDNPMAALERPLVRSLFGAFLLPELQNELGLSGDQVNQLKAQKTDLLAKADDFSRRIALKEKELDALFTPDTSKGQQVKVLLEQQAELRAQQHYAIYTAARKMKGLLTADQRTRLEGWKPEEMRHAAMSRLTLDDFAKATEFLRFAM